MLKLLIVLAITLVIVILLFSLFKKLIKVALFVGLFLVIFIVITSIIFPETRLFEKGKNYILGKTESILDTGKDKVTAYVIKEGNETINNAKDKILESID